MSNTFNVYIAYGNMLSTLLLVMFIGGFELYVPGPGCISTSPIIRINCNIYITGKLY